VMNHVTIHDKCSLQNVVLCNNTVVNKGSSLQQSTIGVGYIVQPKTVLKGEVVSNAHMMES
jgi:ADP-glucose pyrophosphorylase